jgi:hypothetical protein
MKAKGMQLIAYMVFWLLSCNLSNAQNFPSELWHSGVFITTDGDTIKGRIKYDMQTEAVLVETKTGIQTFSARKMHYFEIFDETIDSYRHFYALPYRVQANYEAPMIFEVLYEGHLSLLCREEIVTESVPQYNAYPYGYYNNQFNQSRTRLNYEYYFLSQDGEGKIMNYNMKKNELFTFFGKREKDIKQYFRKNKLKHDRMRDLVRVTAYYNALLDS